MRFTDKQLRQLIIPLVLEQLLAISVGIIDTIMVSSVGEAAVSGVALVDNVILLLINIFTALATGGGVVSGQYIGHGDPKKSCKAADQLVLFVAVLSVIVTGGIYLCQNLILHGIFGQIEQDVYESARLYLLIVAGSIPFIALYSGGAAIFRSMGNSKTPMKISLLMNALNVFGNAILIYGCKAGVEGVAIPTTFSRIVGAVIVLALLRNQSYQVHLSKKVEWHFDKGMIKKILHIGIPSSLEDSMFQMGKILVLSLVATFGTASIAANAVSNALAVFQVISGSSIGLAILTVVSQCVGAGDYQAARFYTKKLMKMIYASMIFVSLAVLAVLPFVLQIYNLSAEATEMTRKILWWHGIVAIFIWPISFALPQALRAANDVKFTMCVSIFSMWMFRIVFSYIIGDFFGLGVFGIWIAMTIDWAFRSICFVTRYLRGKWELHKI